MPIIAVTTFVICTLGVLLGGKAAQKLENKATIFGGLISGAGSGLTLRAGGAIDGVEVMAVIFAKKLGRW